MHKWGVSIGLGTDILNCLASIGSVPLCSLPGCLIIFQLCMREYFSYFYFSTDVGGHSKAWIHEISIRALLKALGQGA